MRIEFHPATLQELIDSARYYESRLSGLGTDFKSEVDRVTTATRLALFQNWNKLA